ncbi:MAG: CBS domain-containing protein [Patescibacteria group bacterium]
MKVADVMSAHVDFVSSDTKVKDVALLIFGRGINGVPVLKGKKVIGFIAERDILAQFYPSLADFAQDPFREGNFEGMEEKVDEIFELPAEKIMSKSVITVTPNTPILRAQSLMFINKIGRLPVVDSNKNLVGIIAQGDIFRTAVGNKLIFTENEEYNDWLSKTYYASVDNEDRLKHEIPDLLKVFAEHNVKSVIDVGCGTGDHSIELARRGFNVVGIDRSHEMIKEANKRKKSLAQGPLERLKFLDGSLEEMENRFSNPFDAAIMIGNTLSHNPHDVQNLLKEVTANIKNKGVLILQITNFDKVIEANNRLLSFSFAVPKGENKEHAFLQFYDKPNLKEKTILKTFAILTNDSGKRWKFSGVRNSLMAYNSKDSIRKILEKLGYKKISIFGGDFDGTHWDYLFRKEFKRLESDWLNVVAVK